VIVDLVAAALALVIAIAGVVVVEPRRRRRRYEAMLEHTAQLEVELGIRPPPPPGGGMARALTTASRRPSLGELLYLQQKGLLRERDAIELDERLRAVELDRVRNRELASRALGDRRNLAELEQAAKWRREALRQAQADMREAQKPRRRESL